jgi:hypothetical protein
VKTPVGVEIRQVQSADRKELREVRVRALADAPAAFASTLQREAAFPDDVWRQRAQGGPASTNFIVRKDGAGVGMAAVVAEPAPGRMQLVGMWVDPHTAARMLYDHVGFQPALQPRCRRGPAAPAPGLADHCP